MLKFLVLKIIFCLDNIISNKIKIKIIKNKVVINDPIDDNVFQKINRSENIIYRRGIPFNPRKCWGKKVRLIDRKRFKKLIFKKFLFIVKLNNIGNQKMNLDKIEKITPMDNT